jgi:hypothetical protein
MRPQLAVFFSFVLLIGRLAENVTGRGSPVGPLANSVGSTAVRERTIARLLSGGYHGTCMLT